MTPSFTGTPTAHKPKFSLRAVPLILGMHKCNPQGLSPHPLSYRTLPQTHHMGSTQYVKQHQPSSPCAARPLQCCHCCLLQGISLATALLLLLVSALRRMAWHVYCQPLLPCCCRCFLVSMLTLRLQLLRATLNTTGACRHSAVNRHLSAFAVAYARAAATAAPTAADNTQQARKILGVCWPPAAKWGQTAAEPAPVVPWAAAAAVTRGLSEAVLKEVGLCVLSVLSGTGAVLQKHWVVDRLACDQ